jgi:hypothetical protein
MKKEEKITEKKYCSCVIQNIGSKYQQERRKEDPNLSAYGLCTYAVYNRQNKKRERQVPCDKILEFEKYDIEILRAYAKEKKVKITEEGKYKKKEKLVEDMYKQLR